MEGLLGRRIDYVVPFKVGGLNTPVMLTLAARMGLAVLDGDALGCSAPETQMTSFIGHGIELTPMRSSISTATSSLCKRPPSPPIPISSGGLWSRTAEAWARTITIP